VESTQKNKHKAPDVSRNVFGGVLVTDGAGHYPGLELLNLIFCNTSDRLLSEDEQQYLLHSHDFARKLVWSPEFSKHPKSREVLLDRKTEEALRSLLLCLQLDIPNKSNKTEQWARAHFFPYTRSLIHWDARQLSRKKSKSEKISIERRYLRGGGALAYHVLRNDPDDDRRLGIEKQLENLFPEDRNTPLESLADVLLKNGVSDAKPRKDDIEPESRLFGDDLEELYREGVHTLLSHNKLSGRTRIRSLFTWTGFWLIRAQFVRASKHLDEEGDHFLCDCGAGHKQIRLGSQRSFKDAVSKISRAFESMWSQMNINHDLPKSSANECPNFFKNTAAAIKLLNSLKGRGRYFTLQIDILETLVLTAIGDRDECTYEWFINEWMSTRCGIVIGRRAAERCGLLGTLDASIFANNEKALEQQMIAAGLVKKYSDATSMVGTEGLL